MALKAKIVAGGFLAGIVVLIALIMWFEGSQVYVWDSLRPFENISESLNTITTIVLLMLSLALFYISLRAFDKKTSPQFLLLTVAFGLFALKFLVQAIDIFYSPGNFFSPAAKNIFDFLVLAALFASLIKKG